MDSSTESTRGMQNATSFSETRRLTAATPSVPSSVPPSHGGLTHRTIGLAVSSQMNSNQGWCLKGIRREEEEKQLVLTANSKYQLKEMKKNGPYPSIWLTPVLGYLVDPNIKEKRKERRRRKGKRLKKGIYGKGKKKEYREESEEEGRVDDFYISDHELSSLSWDYDESEAQYAGPILLAAWAKPGPRGRTGLGLDMDISKNIPIDLELDDDQIRIAEEGDQVPEIQTNPNASRSCSQFQDSCSPSASTTAKRARTISNVWDHFDLEFKDEANGSRPQGCGRGSSSTSSSSSQLLPPINPQQSSDLTQYIELDSDIDPNDENFKVLEWWHKYQLRFPVLSQLARDVLIIPASTISSESIFSTTKMIVDERRTSLVPEIVEAIFYFDRAGSARPVFLAGPAWPDADKATPGAAVPFRLLLLEKESSDGRTTCSDFCSPFRRPMFNQLNFGTVQLVSTQAFISDHSRPPTRLRPVLHRNPFSKNFMSNPIFSGVLNSVVISVSQSETPFEKSTFQVNVTRIENDCLKNQMIN
ncbi:HAT, C-terminal dimerization domain containing protein [Parasponia andersonii]|uniref:HAT, C-terminal dimerization domain containing protein n=1 Tax=Parasponia andersonii TaxID=3476 RepID=A0A2P5C275_PARAD|nr:HAT, C-terminal dimerization domain containing protein [Parasponia andersonii]